MVVRELHTRLAGPGFREKFKGEYAKVSYGDEELVLLCPLTYMNLSGESVSAAMGFFKVRAEKVVVVHDELDLEFGQCRAKYGGGLAGHNGLRSTKEHCGTADFARVRIGIGRPSSGPVDKYVLSRFPSQESCWLPDVVERAGNIVLGVVQEGVRNAMNMWNGKPPVGATV